MKKIKDTPLEETLRAYERRAGDILRRGGHPDTLRGLSEMKELPDQVRALKSVLHLIGHVRLAVAFGNASEAARLTLRLAHAVWQAQIPLIEGDYVLGKSHRIKNWKDALKRRREYLERNVYPLWKLYRQAKVEWKRRDPELDDSKIARNIFISNLRKEAKRHDYKPKGEKWTDRELRKVYIELKDVFVEFHAVRTIREVISDKFLERKPGFSQWLNREPQKK